MTILLRDRIAGVLEGLDGRCLDTAEERAIVADHLAAALSDPAYKNPRPTRDDNGDQSRHRGSAADDHQHR
jgi:hypothetical protein